MFRIIVNVRLRYERVLLHRALLLYILRIYYNNIEFEGVIMKRGLKHGKRILIFSWTVLAILLVFGISINKKQGMTQDIAKEKPGLDTMVQREDDSLYAMQDDVIAEEYPSQFMIKEAARIDKQTGPRCAGFAAAYLLRAMGFEVTGPEMYDRYFVKMTDGGVEPSIVVYTLNTDETDAALYKGTAGQLKTHLAEGVPILIFMGDDDRWQHYLNVVGYDEENFYLIDSNYSTDNSKGFNRTMTSEEFKRYWDNAASPYNNTYFVVERREET